MTETQTDLVPSPAAQQAISKQEKSPVGFGKAGVMLTSLAELWRFAELVQQSGLSPKGLDTPQKVAVAVQYGAEFGVPPMAAIRSVRVINGIPGWMGDMALGIVRASGKMARFEKRYEGVGDERRCVVTTWRRDSDEPAESSFSVADAKRAKLWAKEGPWTQYPDRMLYYRALGFNLRDTFPDVMAGSAIVEELQDHPVIDVKPSRPALAPAPDPLLQSIGITPDPAPEAPSAEPADVAPCCGKPHGPADPCPEDAA